MKYCNVAALLLCAGRGSRTGLEYNKIFYTLVEGQTVLEKSIDLLTLSNIDKIVLVINKDDENEIKKVWTGEYVFGGESRAESVKNGLFYIDSKGGCDVVVIHDCARPFASANLVNQCIDSAKKRGSGIPALPPTDTIKVVEGEKIIKNLERKTLTCVQTPQAFNYEKLFLAYKSANLNATDDSEVFSIVCTPFTVTGEHSNKKITNAFDLSIKVGVGFDVHRLVENRPLILGGVEIPHQKGLLGHSDADVLLHAICDAILSASDLADIGVLFPDTDDSYKGISSSVLLKKVLEFALKKGYKPLNISAVIMAQKPKLAPYIRKIRQNIATITDLNEENVNVSATTTENLGIVGEERGIASSATCLVKKL